MNSDPTPQDVAIRMRQLESHLLRSPAYQQQADRHFKRHVVTLYLAVALLLLFQGLFAVGLRENLPLLVVSLTTVTALLGIANCVLMIHARRWLQQVNEQWLQPEERRALIDLRRQGHDVLACGPADSLHGMDASLN